MHKELMHKEPDERREGSSWVATLLWSLAHRPGSAGADVGFAVLDRLKAEMLHRVGMRDLLEPARLI
jgi:hypothetical protein